MHEALQMHVHPTLRKPSLVLAFAGWNDAGEAGTFAASHLANAWNAVPLADVDPEEFYDFTVQRPTVRLDEANLRTIDWPENCFRFAETSTDHDLVIGVGVEPHFHWRGFTQLMVDLAEELGVERVVLLGAYLADVLYSRPVAISGFANRGGVMDALGVEPTRYEGPTGIVGVLADSFRSRGLEVATFWAGLPHYVNLSPNPRGALALLQVATRYLDLPLDEEPTRKAAAEFEQRISGLVSSDPELLEYVRQLKRREFAQ